MKLSQNYHIAIFTAFFAPSCQRRMEVAENQHTLKGWGNDDFQLRRFLRQPLVFFVFHALQIDFVFQ